MIFYGPRNRTYLYSAYFLHIKAPGRFDLPALFVCGVLDCYSITRIYYFPSPSIYLHLYSEQYRLEDCCEQDRAMIEIVFLYR